MHTLDWTVVFVESPTRQANVGFMVQRTMIYVDPHMRTEVARSRRLFHASSDDIHVLLAIQPAWDVSQQRDVRDLLQKALDE